MCYNSKSTRKDERAQVISLNTSITEIQHLRELLEKRTKNNFLEKYIQKPFLDEYKLRIMILLIEHADSLNPAQKEQTALTSMLVQMALDTHELIPVGKDDEESREEKLSKQLRVLAGDYYSGLYYYLLAEIKDLDLIHKLATAIKEINERKMKLYYKEADSFEDYIETVHEINSLVILHAAEYMHGAPVRKVVDCWLRTHLLTEVLSKRGDILQAWSESFPDQKESSLRQKVNLTIYQNGHELDSLLSSMPETQNALRSSLDRHKRAVYQTLREEG